MSFTAKELEQAIMDKYDELERDWKGEVFQDIWDEEFDPKELGKLEGIGIVELEENSGGQGDGAPTELILKVGDRYFEVNGYYSSWDSSRMDGELYEVKAKEVTIKRYERI
jgi:hypothetical protein